MRKRKLMSGLLALCVLGGCGATVLKFISDPFYWSKPSEGPAVAAEEAREHGTWVSDLDVTPQKVTWNGKTARINEAWIEERNIEERWFIWFAHYKRLGGYYLCFNIAEGDPNPRDDEDGYFSFGTRRGARIGGRPPKNVFSTTLKSPAEVHDMPVFFVSPGRKEQRFDFTFKADRR
jgi:hypothetical protein